MPGVMVMVHPGVSHETLWATMHTGHPGGRMRAGVLPCDESAVVVAWNRGQVLVIAISTGIVGWLWAADVRRVT